MRKMKIALSPGSIGVECTQEEAIGLAHYFGYEAVQPNGRELAAFSSTRLSEFPGELSAFGLVWAAAGLGVDFRKDEPLFQEGLRNWSREVKALQQAGVTRVGTWIMPTHDSLTYIQNFKQHVRRLREVALIAEGHGMRLGLEYVGTKSLWSSKTFPFVHTMVETQELIADIGNPNVGFVLDSWHWWTAEEGSSDILALRNEDVVSCDLNDAPGGIPRDKQHDTSRELPLATGVIPIKDFLEALVQIGYDGPVRAEPFNKGLNALSNAEACSETIIAMRKAFSLIRG
ncbi:MAG: sugar phosphate isomerase/epimerase [Bryobacterales bacterium]|nr:sugar phosphate isomerase/epimerase [Bryobacterales bacterium]MDE0296830.1 sugar phosphate isomerase/epimerase [Bryobacterales bacterium]